MINWNYIKSLGLAAAYLLCIIGSIAIPMGLAYLIGDYFGLDSVVIFTFFVIFCVFVGGFLAFTYAIYIDKYGGRK